MKHSVTALACIVFTCFATSCVSVERSQSAGAAVTVIDDKSLRQDFEKKMAELIKPGGSTSLTTMKEQLERTSTKLELPPTGRKRMSPSAIYQQRIDTTLLLGKFYRCTNEKCKKIHASIASGVIIREDGIVLTNYHVVDDKQDRMLGIGVMTHDGKAFLVDEVLAADKESDVAILRLKGAKELAAAPVFRDEPVGEPVTIISNPTGRFFSLSHGCISRYHISKEGAFIMNVTADYAKGSSGGPIFNDRGDVVGLVANTVSIPYRHVPLHVDEESKALEIANKSNKPHIVSGKPLTIGTNHQMTIKNAVPSRAILDLIVN